jgi:hypothetical protein
MITQQLTNGTPKTVNAGTATETATTMLPNIQPEQTNDVCICDISCEYEEKVFAETGGEWWKNDKSSFLYQKMIASDTVTIVVKKNGVLQATITDDTYGDYTNGFTSKPNYVYFVLDWESIFTAFGAGKYTIEVETDILGVVTTDEYRYFLLPYTDEDADGTIRIEYYQTGNILSSAFDYTGLVDGGIYASYRVPGTLFAPNPVKEVDRYLNNNYEQEQIREKIVREWTARLKYLPSSVTNAIIYSGGLANKFLVTDYNIHNHEIYRRQDLYVDNIEKGDENMGNPWRTYTIEFTDRKSDIVKVNF